MRKVLILMIALFSFSAYSIAQNYTEVVYLKNGSIIKGIIVEQIPNKSVKIQTADGSLFVYNLSEVEKITKEEYSYKTKSTLKGYKGFVDGGYHVDVSDYSADKIEFFTSHGYQFNNYIFLGAGVGVSYFNDWESTAIPVFANFRVNFTKHKVTPFADLKIGYSSGDIEGGYGSTALGVRFGLKNKKALNLRLEYSYQEWKDVGYWGDSFEFQSVGVKFGFEF